MDWEKSVPERYRANYDSIGDRFIILDTWHPQIKNISDLTQDIPENSPAVKIIAGTEMNAVLGTMIKMGWIDKVHNRQIIKDDITKDIINKAPARFPYPKKPYKNNREAEIERVLLKVLKRIAKEDIR